MAIHDVTASLTATATTWQFGTDQQSQGIEYVHFNVGVPVDTPQTNAAYEYVTFSVSAVQENASGAEFVYGEVNNYLRATASMTADAFIQSVFVSGYGTSVAGDTTLLQVPYPANNDSDDLILLLAGGKETSGGGNWFPWNTTFTSGAHSWNAFSSNTSDYTFYSDPYAEDAGRTMASVLQRFLTEPASGNFDVNFPTASANNVWIGRSLRITKSLSKDWNVQHYFVGEHYAYNTDASREIQRFAHNNPFTQTTSAQIQVSAVGWNGLHAYVCGTNDGRIAYSSNAAYWQESVSSPFTSSDQIRSLTWGADKFIAISSTNKMAWSTDGRVWTQFTNPFSSLPNITWNGEYFLGTSGTVLRKSYDGIDWTLKTVGSSASLTKPEYGGGIWITTEMTSSITHFFWYSTDSGETWTRKGLGNNTGGAVINWIIPESNYYGVRPNGQGMWQWTGGLYFGLVTTNDPINGPFYYKQGDYNSGYIYTPFYYYTSNTGNYNYTGVDYYGTSNAAPTLFMQSGYDITFQASLTDNITQFPSWGTAYSSDGVDNYSSIEIRNNIYSHMVHTNRGWLIPAGVEGVVISQYNGSNSWADIDPGDLLIFQLITTFVGDLTTGISISMAGVVLSPITWIPDTSSSLGYNARQYIGYTYVISGAPTGFLLAQWTAPKNNDRSSTMTLTRIRSDVIPNDIKATASLTSIAQVAKTGFFASATFEADAFVEGAPKWGANIGYNYNEIDGNSIGVTSTTVIPAGSLMVITYASDNFSGTLPTITVTDNIGAGTGSWITHVYARQGSSAAGGVTTAIAAKYLTVATSGSYTVTVTLSNNVKAKVCSLSYYTNVYNNALTANAVGATSTTSVSLTSAAQSVIVGASGWENESIYSSVPSGWYSISATRTGTGGNAATHIYLLAMYRITSTAGSYTYNPVLAGNYDWGNALVEFRSGHKVGSIMRVTPTLSATADVHEAVRSGTEPTTITASLTVVDEHIPATGSVVVEHAHADLTADSVLERVFTAQLEVLGTLVAEGSIPQTHLASVMTMSASVNLSAVSPIEVTTLPTIITANTLLTPIIDADTDPVIVVPPPPPEGDETWGSADGVEPEFGPLPPGSGFGNIIEITNRTYSDLYETQRMYRNNDENDRVPYQMQAAQGKVASVGGGRALCMHVQENSWYVGKFPNAPAMLVATVINAGSVNPAVISQRRYELPIAMRGFATTDSSIVELPDGDVIYTVTGMVFADLEFFDPGFRYYSTMNDGGYLERAGFAFSSLDWESLPWDDTIPTGGFALIYGAVDGETWIPPSGWTVLFHEAYDGIDYFAAYVRGWTDAEGHYMDRTGPVSTGKADQFRECTFKFNVPNDWVIHHTPLVREYGVTYTDYEQGNQSWYEHFSVVFGKGAPYYKSGDSYSEVNTSSTGESFMTTTYDHDGQVAFRVLGYSDAAGTIPEPFDAVKFGVYFTSPNGEYFTLDEGDMAYDNYGVPGPVTIAARVGVSGAGYPTYKWVKKWGVVGDFNPNEQHGGDWSGQHWGVLCVTEDGYPIYETISAYYVAWTKVDPVTGAWIEHSNNALTTGEHSVTVTDGSNAALLHEDYYEGKTWYTLGSIDTMTIDTVDYTPANLLTYKGRQFIGAIYRLGSFPDPLATIGWLGTGTTAKWSSSRSEAHLFKWAFDEDGLPYVATTFMADNVLTDDLRGPGHGNLWTNYTDRWYENYGVAEDDTTPWVYYYGNGYDTSSTNWLTAVPCGATGYSYVYLCNELASLSAEPRRSMGVHCTYNLEEADDDGKAGNWYTPPVGNPTWDSYFQKTAAYPTSYSWYCNTHAQTMDNGNIVILLTATNNQLIYTPLSDDWADQWENGETRAFVCIVQGGEAPPLKLTQRDDDKREGAARIAYVPVNGDSQRIGSETY